MKKIQQELVEICLNEHRELLEDLTNSFFTQKISTIKVEEKIGHGYLLVILLL